MARPTDLVLTLHLVKLASIAHCALAIAMVKVAGFGMHAYDINLQQVVNFSTVGKLLQLETLG